MYKVPKFQSGWDRISRRLELNFNQGKTKSAMTHVLILSEEGWAVMAELSRHWWYVRANFGLQNFIIVLLYGINLLKILQSSWFPSSCMAKTCTAVYFSKSSRESLKWLVMGASTSISSWRSNWKKDLRLPNTTFSSDHWNLSPMEVCKGHSNTTCASKKCTWFCNNPNYF